MEDMQNQDQSNQGPSSFQSQESSSGVSFPTVGQPKKSGGVKTLLIVGVLVLVAILGFVIYKSAGTGDGEATPTPDFLDGLTTPSSEQAIPTVTPAASASPSAKVDKTKVEIQVQNGTGITGEAAYLQNQLSTLGYTNVKVGNSDTTVSATSATFATSLDSAVVTEITQKLNAVYQTVNTKTASTGTFDVVIVTGLRKGATAKPAGTATPGASPSASPTATKTPTPTPTSTP
jgi:hypothetical protein